MTPEEEVSILKNSPLFRMLFGENIAVFLPSDAHKKITHTVEEVARKMGMSNITLLLHSGYHEAIAYSHNSDYLLVSERLPQLLNENEFKAMIAHELGHRLQRNSSTTFNKFNNLIGSMNNSKTFNDLSVEKKLKIGTNMLNVMLYKEYGADNTAAELYGVQTMQNALIKMASNAESPYFKQGLDKSLENASASEITERLLAVAAGKSEIDDPITNKRLRFLHKKALGATMAKH